VKFNRVEGHFVLQRDAKDVAYDCSGFSIRRGVGEASLGGNGTMHHK
jgi:hypothetical protein